MPAGKRVPGPATTAPYCAGAQKLQREEPVDIVVVIILAYIQSGLLYGSFGS